MSGRALSSRFVETVKPPKEGRAEYRDPALPGFRFRVTSSGAKSFSLVYRFGGKQWRETWDLVTHDLGKARDEARELLRKVEKGIDPRASKPPQRAPDTVRTVVAEYVEKHAKRNMRSWKEAERLLNLYVVPQLGDRDVATLTRRDIREMVEGVVDKGFPIQANRVLSLTHALMEWAVEREMVGANPASGIKKPTREESRERVLSDDELRAIWNGCDGLGYPAGPLFRLLILTGARRDEVREMRWSEIDLERALWTLPAARSKNKLSHIVPLSTVAVEILKALPRFKRGDHVFSCNSGETPYNNLIKPKATLDTASSVKDWTLHDLRRTCATGMGSLGIAGETIARVLNHSERAIAGVTARYARADYTPAKRAALEAWAGHVQGLLEAQSSNVVKLHA